MGGIGWRTGYSSGNKVEDWTHSPSNYTRRFSVGMLAFHLGLG